MIELDSFYIRKIVKEALLEDIGSGDITTNLTIPSDSISSAVIIAKEIGVIAGIEVSKAAFKVLDDSIEFNAKLKDGSRVNVGDIIAEIKGNTRAILSAERVALNIIQRLSGIATITSKYVLLVSHTNARIVDTRKTTPLLRRMEKYAVTVGGGLNHRFGLDDGILIKDNHIAACGSITKAVDAAKQRAAHTLKIEVEVTNLKELEEAISAKADIVLLDNMDIEQLREAVKLADGRVLLEASGGVNEASVRAIAETGVDIISVGALTHSPKALDISLNISV